MGIVHYTRQGRAMQAAAEWFAAGGWLVGGTKEHKRPSTATTTKVETKLLLRNTFRFDKRQSYAFYSICASAIHTKGINYYYYYYYYICRHRYSLVCGGAFREM